MEKYRPPKWLVDSPLAVDFSFSSDMDDWVFRGPFLELPDSLECNKCGKEISRIFGVNDKEPHALGECPNCRKVHWLEIRQG